MYKIKVRMARGRDIETVEFTEAEDYMRCDSFIQVLNNGATTFFPYHNMLSCRVAEVGEADDLQ